MLVVEVGGDGVEAGGIRIHRRQPQAVAHSEAVQRVGLEEGRKIIIALLLELLLRLELLGAHLLDGCDHGSCMRDDAVDDRLREVGRIGGVSLVRFRLRLRLRFSLRLDHRLSGSFHRNSDRTIGGKLGLRGARVACILLSRSSVMVERVEWLDRIARAHLRAVMQQQADARRFVGQRLARKIAHLSVMSC